MLSIHSKRRYSSILKTRKLRSSLMTRKQAAEGSTTRRQKQTQIQRRTPLPRRIQVQILRQTVIQSIQTSGSMPTVVRRETLLPISHLIVHSDTFLACDVSA